MGSNTSEQTNPDRAGGGDPAPATVAGGGARRARPPVESDSRADTLGWSLALALPASLATWLLVRPFGERAALVVTNLANIAGLFVACWVGLRSRGDRFRRPTATTVPSGETPAAARNG